MADKQDTAVRETGDQAVCVVGDVHGHLQLALCVAARWQRELRTTFEAVLLCGDVGTFTSEDQLDSTTRRHGKANACELEFLHQWSVDPQPPWLAKIFASAEEGGLGLDCPVVMIHGNHEGFAHLETLVPPARPVTPIELLDLPAVDTDRHIRYLPSGWRCRTRSGLVIAGVGGIERGQRFARYHEMAYIDQDAVSRLLDQPPVDILLTHQGPSERQGEKGSDLLQFLLDAGIARFWFHGHSIINPDIRAAGPGHGTMVVPLGDIAFPSKGPQGDEPGQDGWALFFAADGTVRRERPGFWRDYRKRKWKLVDQWRLVSPDLACWT